MALPALVLVHGGGLAADSWELTIDEIQRIAPDLTVLAPDLPGRRNKPGDLRKLTTADFVESVVGDVESAGLNEVVIVGHSMAGMTITGVATRLSRARVRELVFAASFVPPEGSALMDTITGPAAPLALYRARSGRPNETPRWMARFVFLNGVPRSRRHFMAGKLYAESTRLLGEKVTRQGMPDEVPRTWLLTLRDRALSLEQQRRGIEALGGVQTLIEMDTCHCMMVSEPERLAEILVERCRLYA